MKDKYKRLLIIVISIVLILLYYSYSLKGTLNTTDYSNDYYPDSVYEFFLKDNELIQKIVAIDNNFNQINVYLNENALWHTTGNKYTPVNLEFKLLDSNLNIIESYKFENVFFDEYMYIPFEFKPIKNSKGNTYYLYIKSFIKDNDILLELAKSNNINNKLTIDGIESEYSLIYRTKYKTEKIPLYYYIMPTIALISIIAILYLIKNKEIEKKYLLISLTIGVLLSIVTPIYCGHDEIAHFTRIYGISKGNFIIKSNGKWPEISIPYKYIYMDSIQFYKFSKDSDSLENMEMEYQPDDIIAYDMQYSSVYSPLSYLPQTIGFTISSYIMSDPSILLFITRIVQLLFCIYIMYNAIKITPFAKSIFMFIGILPSTLQAMCLVSTDGILISFFMLLMAKVLQLAYSDKEITQKDYIVLLVSSIFVAITKLVYFPLSFLLILIALNRKEKGLKKNIGIIIGISFVITLIWNLVATSNLVSGQGVNVFYYIGYYLKNPIEFIQITIFTFFRIIGRLISDVFGAVNDWHGTIINDGGIVPVLFFIIFMIYVFKGENRIKNSDKKIMGIILTITYLIISTVLHLTCTPVHNMDIIGIQGRYFIPFLICIYLIGCKNKDSKIDDNKYSYIFVLLELYYCLYVFSYFIILFSKLN